MSRNAIVPIIYFCHVYTLSLFSLIPKSASTYRYCTRVYIDNGGITNTAYALIHRLLLPRPHQMTQLVSPRTYLPLRPQY